MVLAPHVRAQQVVEARDARTPPDLAGGLEPLGVLVEHRVDEVDEGLVAAEEPVPPGQQVALEPALAGVLGEDLHHPTGPGEVLVDVMELARPDLVGHLVDGVEPVGRGLVGPEDAEVGVVVADHADEPLAQDAGRLVDGRARTLHLDGALPPVGQAQRPLEQAAVGVRVGAHPPGARRRLLAHRLHRSAVVAEELVGGVRAQPLLELRAVLVVLPGAGQRHLVGPPRALDRLAVDLRRAGPALRRDEQDHRPRPALQVAVLAGRAPGLADHVVGLVERSGHLAVHVGRVVALDGDHVVAVAAQQALELFARDPGGDGRVGDLPAVEGQDRQHRAVVDRVDELVAVPARGQRAGLELAVADHRGHDEVGVVHRGAVGVREHVAELAALVDGAGCLRGDVARDAAGEGELPEQPRHPVAVVADRGVHLRVGALEPRVGHRRRPAVARARTG